MISKKYIAPGQGLTTPWGRNFEVNRNVLSIHSHVASLKKNVFEVWFYTIFFIIYYMYIAQGQGQTAPRGQNFDVNRMALSLYPFVASFKEISWKSDFFFHDLMHVYSPWAGGIQPPGDKILTKGDWEKLETNFFFHRSRARNSKMTSQIQPKFELVRAFMPVLITCKFDEDWIQSNWNK